ncbi:MAG: XTP/dITP diphosphatase [Aigarchaeota archaeon]|nr:XTP/dITP diphosphatase [Aigarchaeota archaeon]MCX8192840.1 XTP/dITP diphosphatase [Nitrososphaeria archaeon]MDW7986084.1 XTP/dITP diphosphatase [Nitrososphaerota archaeon]
MRFTLVTTNKGKIEEFKNIFQEFGLKFRVELLKTKEVQSVDLVEIASQSALYAYNILREPVLVEDAGLFIKSLNGFPGPYSSYVYRTIGVNGILKLMESEKDRSAVFFSIIAFYGPYSGLKIFSGESRGIISFEPRGLRGFGFDPIFIPEEGGGETYAEMDIQKKNKISHRGKAARKFAEWFSKLIDLPPPYVDIR